MYSLLDIICLIKTIQQQIQLSFKNVNFDSKISMGDNMYKFCEKIFKTWTSQKFIYIYSKFDIIILFEWVIYGTALIHFDSAESLGQRWVINI